MARNDFAEPVKRLLAERSAYRCSSPDCQRATVGASISEPNKVIKPGVAAHIHAASEGGPRYDSAQTSDERSSASNGIWLCEFCASMVDKNQGCDFPAGLLKQWKELHELRTFAELTTGVSEVGLTGWCEEFEGNWKLFVKNPTNVPFYDCVVRGFKQENFGADFGDIESVFGTIPPRQTLDDPIDYEVLGSDIFGYPHIDVEYTDAEGLHWLRHSSGKLEKIDFRRPFD